MAPKIFNTKKKRRGIYYTPINATKLLCDWAIRSSKDLILEPSFGGCGFLQSSKERLVELGCKEPNKKLYGCDIDKRAFQYLSEKIGPVDLNGRFLLTDFLTLKPANFNGGKVDVIIGNPPYVAHHEMYKKQIQTASNALDTSKYAIRGRTSLWAYFLIHSLRFLKQSGRMAWLLPGSLINTYYGKDILNILDSEFANVLILPCAKRIFVNEGANENTVVLLAEGKEEVSNHQGIKVSYINSLDEFEQVVHNTGKSILRSSCETTGKLSHVGLSRIESGIYEKICADEYCTKLRQLVDIKIGIVTGNNKFFIISQDQATQCKLPRNVLRPIFSKQRITRGIQLHKSDLQYAQEMNFRCLLVDTQTNGLRNNALKRYIKSYSKKDRESVKTFYKRVIWHQPDDGNNPGGFFTYMCHMGPRLILNDVGSTSTNTIHRVYFNNCKPKYQQKLLSISLLTTFSQLSAELEGRSYGSGVLKLEPNEAKAICVFMPNNYSAAEVNKQYSLVDDALRKGNVESARNLADKFIFRYYFSKNSFNELAVIKQALATVRMHRIGTFK